MNARTTLASFAIMVTATSAFAQSGTGIEPRTSEESSTLADRYAVVCIHNDYTSPIVYEFRWGDEAWKSYTVNAGDYRWHSWKYETPNQPHSPQAQIRFDSDFSSGTSWLTYNLDRYRLADERCEGAKQYRFKKDEGAVSGTFIELYEGD